MRHKTVMDSYIVRIYRRVERDPDFMAGVVEDVGKGEKLGFANVQELLNIFSSEKRKGLQGVSGKSRTSARKNSFVERETV